MEMEVDVEMRGGAGDTETGERKARTRLSDKRRQTQLEANIK